MHHFLLHLNFTLTMQVSIGKKRWNFLSTGWYSCRRLSHLNLSAYNTAVYRWPECLTTTVSRDLIISSAYSACKAPCGAGVLSWTALAFQPAPTAGRSQLLELSCAVGFRPHRTLRKTLVSHKSWTQLQALWMSEGILSGTRRMF